MQSLRTALVSFQNFLAPTNVVSLNIQRTYVRNFWAKNNDYKGIPGIKRNPPKMYGYTYSKRNVSFQNKSFSDLIHTGAKSLIYPKIHILKISFLTKFTISMSHFSQNSHFSSFKFLVISGKKVTFCHSV